MEASLWRIYSNVFSTTLTVGHCASWFPGLHPTHRSKEEFHIHLLGADEPEVKAVQEGIIQVTSCVIMLPVSSSFFSPVLLFDLVNNTLVIIQITSRIKLPVCYMLVFFIYFFYTCVAV